LAKRPAFSDLKKAKPAPDEPAPSPRPVPVVRPGVHAPAPSPVPAAKPERVQTSIRLDPAMWAALVELSAQKRLQTGQRTSVHDLLIEGARHILAVNGVKLSE